MISVMIPAYNAERTMEDCVRSVLNQTFQDFEVLVIDDGSTDRTPQILEQYAAKDARIRVIHQENGGVAAARNRAIRESRGEFLTFLDSDDRLRPDYLEVLYDAMIRTGCACVCCNHHIIRGTSRTLGHGETEIMTLTADEALENQLYHGIPNAAPWGKLYRRELLIQITYPEGLLFEDTYVIADILLRSGQIVFLPEPLYEYHIRETSISRTCKDGHIWDFCTAVEHMTEVIGASLSGVEDGCTRRRAHAILSTMRTLDPQRHKSQWKKARGRLCEYAVPVLLDRKAPYRDKLGILAALSGQRVFRLLWGLYEKTRRSHA